MRGVPFAAAARGLDVGAVEEMQGLYGPFTFPEKLLQKIWLRGDFDRRKAVVSDGRRLTIRHPGRWNLLGGPDFRDARLQIGDGPEINGDVELHLRAYDWMAHGHAADPAYDKVVLHVVLFPAAPHLITVGAGGRVIPVVALLPLLHHDLEEYAAEEAVENLANRPAAQIVELLGPLPQPELNRLIAGHARARWHQKVHFARLRIQRLGWREACHQSALEVLGYRFNRATMLRIAAAHPLAAWADKSFDPNVVFEAEPEGWSLQGLRPANHPRRRLKQYSQWVQARSDWPTALEKWASQLPVGNGDAFTASVRSERGFTELRAKAGSDICGEAIGGTRFDNLMCDGFLPLAAAKDRRELADVWHHWFAGDLPPLLLRALRLLQVFGGRDRPACHGAAQGLLGWLIERERSALGPQGRGA